MANTFSDARQTILAIWTNRPRHTEMLADSYDLYRYDLSAEPDALLDVYADEPKGGAVFSTLDNVSVYPHLTSGTIKTSDAMAQLLYDNLDTHFASKPLLTPVN